MIFIKVGKLFTLDHMAFAPCTVCEVIFYFSPPLPRCVLRTLPLWRRLNAAPAATSLVTHSACMQGARLQRSSD